MGGYGSGRTGGSPTVESAIRLNIDRLTHLGILRSGSHVSGKMSFDFYDQELEIQFESRVADPWDSWLRLKYVIHDYWTGEPYEIDDQIRLTTTRPSFGGRRWWFICPRSNRRVRMLHLPLGGRHFWSRRSYRLAYASQRETVYDRALRRSRKLCRRLGGDPADEQYPDKPPRMRWATYNRIMDNLMAADHVADARLIVLARKLGMT